ncbi:MAG: fumarylacetoacetate hydrolase family protein [Bacteroidota bacterium]
MKIYKTEAGVLAKQDDKFYLLKDAVWDDLVNDDFALDKVESLVRTTPHFSRSLSYLPLKPIADKQELWACGVTYLRSKIGRQEESKDTAAADFYAKVYEAERPEVFFKATPQRIVATNELVNIRKDSTWDVPEPELTLVVTSSQKIIGYTVGNDMSSRSIEGENPLYLPQAKTYDGCAALGPCIYLTNTPLPASTEIRLGIIRDFKYVFEETIAISQMKRTPEELVSFVFRECSFPHGCFIMTGTGIVPGNNFTLQSEDEIEITIDGIGSLINFVR